MKFGVSLLLLQMMLMIKLKKMAAVKVSFIEAANQKIDMIANVYLAVFVTRQCFQISTDTFSS